MNRLLLRSVRTAPHPRPGPMWFTAITLWTCLAFPFGPPAGAAPALVGYEFSAPDTLANGRLRPLTRLDTIEIVSRWEVPDAPDSADSLRVTADFSSLDPEGDDSREIVARLAGPGTYVATYTMAGRESRPDTSGIKIPLTASGRTGTTVDARIEVCLSNHPPLHVSSRIVRPKGAPYKPADSLLIETVWRSDFVTPLRIRADLTQILTDTSDATPPRISRLGDDLVLISWRLPFFAAGVYLPDGNQKHIPILAEDAGCGRSMADILRVDIDTTPPDSSGLSLDPLPAVTSDDSVLVTGRAVGSPFILVYRDLTVREVVQTDSLSGRYSARIALALGENRVQIKGEDIAGNTTPLFPAAAAVVARVDGAEFKVAKPYSRTDRGGSADDIVLRDPSGIRSAIIRVFNLEGDCLWEERAEDAEAAEFGFHWDGVSGRGERAPQGYYLVRAEWRAGDGRTRAQTQGMLLRD